MSRDCVGQQNLYCGKIVEQNRAWRSKRGGSASTTPILGRGVEPLAVAIPSEELTPAPPRPSGELDVSSKRRQGKMRKLSERNCREMITTAQVALGTNPFPKLRKGALVDCLDAGGQHPYEMVHSLFIRRASILSFVINLKSY